MGLTNLIVVKTVLKMRAAAYAVEVVRSKNDEME
jgi:hypothetical protein